MLTMRLEEAACALESACGPRDGAAHVLQRARVATANAVALDLLSARRAASIWRGAARRHPALAAARLDRPAAAQPS
jgi:hypothetical protein